MFTNLPLLPNEEFIERRNHFAQCLGTETIAIIPAASEKTRNSDSNYTYRQNNGIGHHLGLDVHDITSFKNKGQPTLMKTGMVFTIEPGIYIRPNEHILPKWHHIGIRIEDDILVTDTGYENLTKELIKEVADLECFCLA